MVYEQVSHFQNAFSALNNGKQPYPWQARLFDQFATGNVPDLCCVPTGLGKTSVIPLWLIALAWQAQSGSVTLPRRLVYVVNRRTIVDQATTVSEMLIQKLDAPDPLLAPLSVALESLGSKKGGSPVVVSTLRGQYADNGEWKSDPARPAIILGTVDMVGSKLLFNGYGDGKWMRPFHAGLLGHDTLLVLDEGHLTPAFGYLVRKIVELQQEHGSPLKPFRFMEMTATPRGDMTNFVTINEEDRTLSAVRNRLQANKTLRLKFIGEEEKSRAERHFAEKVLVYEGTGKAVIVFVRSPELVAKIAEEVQKVAGEDRVRVLTGTMRGHERDGLVKDETFRRFMTGDFRTVGTDTCYLISTSAGEVGADLDADEAVFDMTTIDSLIQRCGRVNRAGGRSSAIDVIIFPKDLDASKQPGLNATLEIIRTLPARGENSFSVSPDDLMHATSHARYAEAVEEAPRLRTLEPYLLDTWSMTGLDEPGGPQVAPWLHGIQKEDVPNVWLAWRSFIPTDEQIESWRESCPLVVRELAQLPVDRFKGSKGFLESLSKRVAELGESSSQAVLYSADGKQRKVSLLNYKEWEDELPYSTLVIHSSVGGLQKGQPLGSAKVSVEDVSGYEAWRLIERAEGWMAIREGQEALLFDGELDVVIAELAKLRNLSSILTIAESSDPAGDDENSIVVFLGTTVIDHRGFRTSRGKMLLDSHHKLVQDAACSISKALGLPPEISNALTIAAGRHDSGKDRRIWQISKGNFGGEVYAKYYAISSTRMSAAGYRHELGSILDSKDILDDLSLHLIASHHGYGRPSFQERAADINFPIAINREAAYGAMLRFDALQRQYGWWTLAYLEALLKSADVIGSTEVMPCSL